MFTSTLDHLGMGVMMNLDLLDLLYSKRLHKESVMLGKSISWLHWSYEDKHGQR